MSGWRPIESAPRDGTRILAWTVHENAKYAKDPEADGYAVCSVIQWIDHNGGGWTWNGLAGVHTHWMPLPSPPSEAASPLGGPTLTLDELKPVPIGGDGEGSENASLPRALPGAHTEAELAGKED